MTVSVGIKPASAGSILGPGGGAVVQLAATSAAIKTAEGAKRAGGLIWRPPSPRRASPEAGSRCKSYGYRPLCNPSLEARESGWETSKRPPTLEERTRRH